MHGVEYRKERRKFKSTVRRKKREHWKKFLEDHGGKHSWEILRIARQPFGKGSPMGDLQKDDGTWAMTGGEQVKSFQVRNLVLSKEAQGRAPAQAPAPRVQATRRPPSQSMIQEIERGLNRTASNSAPSPDGIGYRLLKLIRSSTLGKGGIEEIAGCAEEGVLPEKARDMKIVMIPKPGKNQAEVKGWRPIVLAQTVGKVVDKAIAGAIQKLDVFHHLSYGSRTGRSATDALMLSTSMTQRSTAAGKQVTLLGKDVVSAFNHLRKEGLLQTLTEGGCRCSILRYMERSLGATEFSISWDGQDRGKAHMDQGIPQGSSLSPVL